MLWETPKKYKFAEVHWEDAVSALRWTTGGELPKPSQVVSRGWVVAEELTHITLAGTLQTDHNEEFGEIICIPRAMILFFREMDLDDDEGVDEDESVSPVTLLQDGDGGSSGPSYL